MEPNIIVERFPSEKDWTLSEFFINGVKQGVGVEDEKRDVKVFGETRIPNGIYELEITHSPKFSGSYFSDVSGYISDKKSVRYNTAHLLITLKDVPNFSRILWHWGNTDLDTHGCYIVGSSFGVVKARRGVVGSRAKYVEVYPKIFQLIVNNKNKGLKTFVEYKDK
jgi:hypothetical protein